MKYGTMTIGRSSIYVLIPETAEEYDQGLRDMPLDYNQGMLFANDFSTPLRMEMRGMGYPLDFVFFADGHVVQVDENVRNRFFPPTVTGPPGASVVEVNAGYVEAWGVRIGDSVSLAEP